MNHITVFIFIFPQQCFADDRDNTFETTSWSTYLRYVSTNKSLVYVLIFIFVVFVIEVSCCFGSYCGTSYGFRSQPSYFVNRLLVQSSAFS